MTFGFVQPDRNKAVVLNRVAGNPDPPYIPCGRTRCLVCDQWCWLGDKTLALVSAGGAQPICTWCASRFNTAPLVDMLQDTKRKDQNP